MTRYTYETLKPFIQAPHETIGDRSGPHITNARPVQQANEASLAFISAHRKDAQALAEATEAPIIICDTSVSANSPSVSKKLLIVVKDPKLVFSLIVRKLFLNRPDWGVHPTASIHRAAEVHTNTYIGPFCYVGRATIGEGSTLFGHTHIYDNVRIGRNVTIHAGCIIGADGFGYLRDEQGASFNFPHIGGVDIQDDVEIGANTCVDRGALGDTVIGRAAKIGNLVHIAHNVIIGEEAFVAGNAMIAGSTVIGKHSYIAPSVTLMDVLNIGENATVRLAAVVTKDVPANETWIGAPARPLAEFLGLQKKLKKL